MSATTTLVPMGGSLMLPPAVIADPRRDVRMGVIIAALFFVGFLGWAAFARLDAAATASGMLEVSGQRQTVQHKDGGVVGRLLVREGQHVTRGQLLVRLAAADVEAQEHVLASQAISLLAQRARLQAEQAGIRTVAAPVEFASLPAGERAQAADVLRQQQHELQTRASVLAAQTGALGQRASEVMSRGHGYQQQAISATEQVRLLDQELEALAPVAAKGFVSQSRMRDLQRARAELVGQQGQYTASVAESRQGARESALNMLTAQNTFRQQVASDLRDVETRLSDVLPRLIAARDQLARTEIRATATGTVLSLSVFTPGAVISPGQKVLDIVPDAADLRIKLRIAPEDIDDVLPGQQALIKFPGLHDRRLKDLEGVLDRVSADSLIDPRTGAAYFEGEVVIPPSQMAIIASVRGTQSALRAGMPAQALIKLHKRTALQYAFEPLTESLWHSFGEH
jgi:HlyD family type I secretion membrane fusion protein